MENLKVNLISAFPGTGKSTLVKMYPKIKDSDSSLFPKDHFPENYLDYLKRNVELEIPSMISTHSEVRSGLRERGLQYLVVYPEIGCKEEYLQRYRDRNSPQGFINLLDKMWETWITALNDDPSYKVILKPGQYLRDIISYEENSQGNAILRCTSIPILNFNVVIIN